MDQVVPAPGGDTGGGDLVVAECGGDDRGGGASGGRGDAEGVDQRGQCVGAKWLAGATAGE